MPPSLRSANVLAVIACSFLLLSSPTRAAGLYLAWNTCFGEVGATQNKNFACNTNVGSHLITGSFVLSQRGSVVSSEAVIEWATDSPVLPAWWQMRNTGSCRPVSLAMNTAPFPGVACEDWALGQATGLVQAYCTAAFPCAPGYPYNPNVGIIRTVKVLPPGHEADLVAGMHYSDFNLVINNAKTVGTGSCDGCTVPVCIVFNSIRLNSYDTQFQGLLAGAAVPGSNFITWQGGGSPTTWRGTGCPRATPVRASTWGAVKSLYH